MPGYLQQSMGSSPLGLEEANIQNLLRGQTTPVSIHSPNKHFLHAYSVPGSVVYNGDKEISKTHGSFQGLQNTLTEEVWMGLHATKPDTTTFLDRKPHTRPRQSILLTTHWTLPNYANISCQNLNRKYYHQAVMWFLWNRAIFILLCISREFFVNPTVGSATVDFHSPSYQIKCTFMSGPFFQGKVKPSVSALQKQKHWDLALSDQEHCLTSNSSSLE